jgi:hypothetical protein
VQLPSPQLEKSATKSRDAVLFSKRSAVFVPGKTLRRATPAVAIFGRGFCLSKQLYVPVRQ